MTAVLFAIVAVWALGIALRCVYSLETRFLSAVLFGGYGITFGLAPLVLFWDESLTATPGVACLLGLAGLVIGRGLARKQFGPPQELNLELLQGKGRWRIVLAAGSVGVLGVILFAYGTAGSLSGFIASSRFEFRLKPASPIMSILGLYLIPFIGMPAAVMTVGRSAWTRLLGLAMGLIVAYSLFVFMKGTRSVAIGMALTVLILWLSSQLPGANRVKPLAPLQEASLRVRVVAGTLVVGVAMMILLPALHQARQELGTSSGVSIGTYTGGLGAGVEGVFAQDPLNYSEFTVDVTKAFPSEHDYLWLYPVRRLVLFPLPSGGLKPLDTNKVVAQVLGFGRNETTIPPSLPGEGYVVAGGLPGVLPWAVLYGFAIGAVESRMSRRVITVLVIPIGMASVLLALRGQLYEISMTFLFSYAVIAVIVRVTQGSRKRGQAGSAYAHSGRISG